jgi:Na+/glutamate symporter
MARDYAFRRIAGFAIKVALATALMALAVLSAGHFHLAVRVLLGVAVYLLALFGLKILKGSTVLRYWVARRPATEGPS